MKLLNQIEKSTCLLLDKRFGNWFELCQQAEQHGINLEPFVAGSQNLPFLRYDHIDEDKLPPRYPQSTNYPTWYTKQAYNAWKCHKKIIKRALDQGCQNLLMMEDDIQFESDYWEILGKTESFFLNNPWDIIYWGAYYYNNQVIKITENIRKLGQNTAGFHCVLLKRNILEILDDILPYGPIDWLVSEFLHKKFDTYAIYPSIVTQKDNIFSFIEQSILKKPSRYGM